MSGIIVVRGVVRGSGEGRSEVGKGVYDLGTDKVWLDSRLIILQYSLHKLLLHKLSQSSQLQ